MGPVLALAEEIRMARRKNTAEAFEILYRRSREKTSESGPAGSPTASSAAWGATEPGDAHEPGAGPSDRLPARRARSGSPLRPPRLLRRPPPAEPVLRSRAAPRSLGRALPREPGAAGDQAVEDLYPVRYQAAPLGPYPGEPGRAERRVYRVTEWASDPRSETPARREPTSWLPRWMPSRRERPRGRPADIDGPRRETAGGPPPIAGGARGFGARGFDARWSGPEPLETAPACEGPPGRAE
jgi:hypothetical protein